VTVALRVDTAVGLALVTVKITGALWFHGAERSCGSRSSSVMYTLYVIWQRTARIREVMAHSAAPPAKTPRMKVL